MKSITIDIAATDTQALDLATVKRDLRISDNDLDSILSSQYIPAAAVWAENTIRRSLIARVHIWITDGFPQASDPTIYLPRGVVQSVTSIAYTQNGSVTTLTGPSSGSPGGTDYQEDLTGHVARVMPLAGSTWPAVDTDVIQPVKITYTAGWTSDKLVPGDIKRAMTAYIYGAMELDGLLTIRPGFDMDFAEKLISAYRSPES